MRAGALAIVRLGLAVSGSAISGWAGAQEAVQPVAKPVVVALDLYTGDKNSKGFADGLTAAISGDDRFQLVTTLPADGLKIIMKEALVVQDTDMQTNAGYDVVLKLGNGKYLDEKTGLCDLSRLPMCGRVVAQDSYDAYQAYLAHRKPK